MSSEAQRHAVIKRFLETAQSGDIEVFTRTLTAIDWPGAWRDILTEAAWIERVHPDVQRAFHTAWHGSPDHPAGVPLIAGRNRWSLSRDLAGSYELLSAMKRLLPPSDAGIAPLVLYRGQSLAEHEAGAHGLWWSPEPTYAEFYARDPRRADGGVVVAAFAPADAIVSSLSAAEFLVDPRRLSDVIEVAELPAYTTAEMATDTFYASRLMGIPHGWDAEGIDQWLALGRPKNGVRACRFRREVVMFQLVMTAAE